MQSPNFNFKLDIRCDEIEAGNFQFDQEAGGDESIDGEDDQREKDEDV